MQFNRKLGFLITSGLVICQPISSYSIADNANEWSCRPSADGASWECAGVNKPKGPLPQAKQPLPKPGEIAPEEPPAPVSEEAEAPAEETSDGTSSEATEEALSQEDQQEDQTIEDLENNAGELAHPDNKFPVPVKKRSGVKEASKLSAKLKPTKSMDWVPLSDLSETERAKVNLVCEGAYIDPIAEIKKDSKPEESPIEASADSSQYDEATEVVTLEGDVLVRQGHRQLGADKVQWSNATKEAEMSGNIYFREPGVLVTGEKAHANLDSGHVEVNEASFVLHKNGARGEADRITLDKSGVVVVDKGRYTTCIPGSDEWFLQGSDIRLYPVKGYGTAKNVQIRIKNVPIIYSPYLAFPIGNVRKSGFLLPNASISSDNGFELSVPYYWNIAPNYDATITPRIFTERGLMLEGEFRYLQPGFEGEFGVAFLPSDAEHDHDNRWLLGWLHQSDLSKRWIWHVDYTRVSDDDYFHDFDTELDFDSDTHLLQLAETVYRGDHWDLSARVQSFQTLDEEILNFNEPYDRLPQIVFNGAWQQPNLPIEYSMQSEYVYFERDNHNLPLENQVIGHRLHIEPGISFPFEWSYGYVTPSAKLKYTQYILDDQAQGLDDNPSRSLPVLSLDSGLYYDRIFAMGESNYTQTLEPRLYYLYVPYDNQDDIPIFDTTYYTFSYDQLFRDDRFVGGDRVGDTNQLSLGVTTRLINNDTGREQLRASIGEIFYFKDRKISLGGNANDDFTHDTDSSSAIAGEVIYRAGDDWYVQGDFLYDIDDQDLDEGSVSLRYYPDDNHLFNISYRQRDDIAEDYPIKQSDVAFLWPIANRWSAVGRWNYDWENTRTIETFGGLEYEACCWRVRLLYRQWLDDEELDANIDRGVFLQVQLKGLGGVGNKVTGILNRGIFGFREREKNGNY